MINAKFQDHWTSGSVKGHIKVFTICGRNAILVIR